jgi:predicted GNAT family acetyltransferase
MTTHVVRIDEGAVAWCHLYRVAGEAQIEDVVTTPPWRGRGMARAIVLDALGTACEAGCEFVFLVALADDWPWRLYERLGFVRLGQMHQFVRREVPTG